MNRMLKHIFILSITVVLSFPFVVSGQNQNTSPKATMGVIANSDFVLMLEGSTEEINVLNNDNGLLSGVSELTITNGSENAEVLIEDFMIVYTPNIGFVGNDELTYRVCNNDGECDETTVSIIVEDVDFIPIAYDDYETIDLSNESSIDVLSNDEELYDLPISIYVIRELNHGFSTIETDNSLKVTFDERANKDSLLYEVCDAEGNCSQAWLYLDITTANSQEVFIPQGISPNGDGINDLFNIPDFEELQLQIKIYDNNGVEVFKSLDYNNNWDGSANEGKDKGNILGKGIYYYLLKVKDTNKEYTGFIYLN